MHVKRFLSFNSSLPNQIRDSGERQDSYILYVLGCPGSGGFEEVFSEPENFDDSGSDT